MSNTASVRVKELELSTLSEHLVLMGSVLPIFLVTTQDYMHIFYLMHMIFQ